MFYDGEQGLRLVAKENGKFVPSIGSEVAQEILGYLRREHDYGNKVTGKQLIAQFSGLGYGWEQDVIRLVVAVLFRAGALIVTHQGRPYRNYQEPSARLAFATNVAFRAAGLAPRESIDLKTLTTAVRALEDMIGEEVDIEEGAIAEAFKKLARAERDLVLPALATARANSLPVLEILAEWSEQIEAVLGGSSDDCVRMLAGEGKTIRELRNRSAQARAFLTDKNVGIVRNARDAEQRFVPALKASGDADTLGETPEALNELLHSPDLPTRLEEVQAHAQAIEAAYTRCYKALHERRFEAYDKAIQQVRGRAEFLQLNEANQTSVLRPLEHRAFKICDLPPFALNAQTLGELQADLDALPGLESAASTKVQELIARTDDKGARLERIRLADFFTGQRNPEKTEKQNIDDALDKLRERLYGLLDEGVKILWE